MMSDIPLDKVIPIETARQTLRAPRYSSRAVAHREWEPLTGIEWKEALAMWRQRYDTLEVAQYFGVPEHVIYNGLSRIRDNG